jgi:uncharacterized membrane protein
LGKTRLEAFSDGVIAIIITIMVLELKVPHGASLVELAPLLPVFLAYVLSFLYIAIYWNNHHHMLHTCRHVTAGILWANMLLLFWLSLIPFATGWMGENDFAPLPTMLYGVDLLLAAVSYFILQHAIIVSQGKDSLLRKAVGRDWKGWVSLACYVLAISVALIAPAMSQAIYVLVAMTWLLPDRRIERALAKASDLR